MLQRIERSNSQHTQTKNDNVFLNIGLNIFLPAMILKYGNEFFAGYVGQELAPLYTLYAALSLPVGYGIYDYIVQKKRNWFAAFGVLNVLLTGGLAVLQVGGFWFVVKETAVPLLIGIFVFGSAYFKKPFVKLILYNPMIINTSLIEQRLNSTGHHKEFDRHLKVSTQLLAGSFFLSAFLNFVLASWIFTDIDPALDAEEKSKILNQQIGDMTWIGYVVILAPSMACMVGIFWHLLSGIKKFTGLELNDVFHAK